MPKTLFILDASGYLYRAYHAISGMTNARGESTNALFGFVRSIHKLIQTVSPTYFVAVFDAPRGTHKRRALYADYKSHRAAMPDDLRVQREWIIEFCSLSGIPVLSIPDVEADDTMASVALWAAKEGAQVFLCTSDKDMAQLVSPQIQIMNPSRDHEVYGEKEIVAIHGVPPRQLRDLLALIGDASDNVPGVPGLGPKTAATLLQEYGTLENMLEKAKASAIPGKRGEILRQHADIAVLSQTLVTLHEDVHFPHDWSFFQMGSTDKEALQKFYQHMQFRSLIEKSASPTQDSSASASLTPCTTLLIQDELLLKNLVEKLCTCKEICIHTESLAAYPLIESPLIGVALAISPHESWYIPFNGVLSREVLCAHLRLLIDNVNISWVGHNIKKDAHVMARAGLALRTIGFDTLIASHILRAHDRQHSLEVLARNFLERICTDFIDLTGSGKKAIPLTHIPLTAMNEACGMRAICIYLLKERFVQELRERQMEALYYELELPLLSCLLHMEQRGIFVDAAELTILREQLQERLKTSEEIIYGYAGEHFSINSPKQLSTILFEKHKLPPVRKTATGFSTDAEVLETLSAISPLAHSILEYRTLEKLRSTYVDALPLEISPRTGRIHPTFHQAIVATGRLSCQNPNLQNIPVRSEEGRMIRAAFRVEDPSWFYLGADYSQIELRFLAHFSQDEALLEAFSTGRDIHTHTASLLLQKPMSDVTSQERQRVKAVNFGIIYGQQAFGLSKELGISQREAADFIALYFQRYPKVQEYIRSSIEKARQLGYAETLCGRQRPIPDMHSPNHAIRGAAERLAMNTPLQGSAADLIKKAMIAIDRHLISSRLKTGMIAQIHDELLFEVPPEEIKEMEIVVRREMEQAMQLSVPLIVDIHIGKNWREC